MTSWHIGRTLRLAVILLSCVLPAACTSTEREPPALKKPTTTDTPSDPTDPPLNLDATWLLLSDRADGALYQMKLGEMMVRSAEGDKAKRSSGYRHMAAGLSRLLATLTKAKAFFAAIRKSHPRLDMGDFEKAIMRWAHDMIQARKMLPKEYLKRK